MWWLLTRILLCNITCALAIFTWLEGDTKFDYIVGIEVDRRPICPGVLVSMYSIVTSANPLEPYRQNPRSIRIHTIYGAFNNSRVRTANTTYVNQSKRRENWIRVGFESDHTTIHDISFIMISDPMRIVLHRRGSKHARLAFEYRWDMYPLHSTGWKVAGFGYYDRAHVEKNTVLEVTSLSGHVVDCDEWLPRSWGIFICITNDDSLPCVPSGGPLVHESSPNIVMGIGAFHLRRGLESILVFTYIKKYGYSLVGYYQDDKNPYEYKAE